MFRPGVDQGELPKHLNLWMGWGVTEINGDCCILLDHILEVICDGDLKAYEAILNWLAWGVQHPGKPCPQAVAIRGLEGSGKSVVAEIMSDIYSEAHSWSLSDPNMLTGDFNGHLSGRQFITVEEAFFTGDHKAVRRLKDIITNRLLTIHAKGLTPFQVPNVLRILMTANDEQLLEVSGNERRWLIVEANNSVFPSICSRRSPASRDARALIPFGPGGRPGDFGGLWPGKNRPSGARFALVLSWLSIFTISVI